MRRRTGALWGAGVAFAAAAVAHGIYWYGPRERSGAPSAEADAVLRDPAWESALWIAYPHQNLGALEGRVGEIRSWLALLRKGGPASAQALPRFGPFAVPPAAELVVAERDGGRELRALVRVYPAVRGIARAAGRLAGNPWLAGGEVRLGEGRRARVAWREGLWSLETGPDRTARAARRPARAGEGGVRALLRLGRPLGPLPAGAYRLVRSEAGLELRSGPAGRVEPARIGGGSTPPAAWHVEVREGRVRALLLWSEPGVAPPFPAAATLHRGGEAPRLPGEELLRIAGRDPARAEAAGFEIRALGREEAERAAGSAGELADLLARNPDLRLVAGADLDRLRIVAERIADRFRGLPIARLAGFDADHLARVLAAAEGCGVSRLELRGRPERLRWLLCPGPEAPPEV